MHKNYVYMLWIVFGAHERVHMASQIWLKNLGKKSPIIKNTTFNISSMPIDEAFLVNQHIQNVKNYKIT